MLHLVMVHGILTVCWQEEKNAVLRRVARYRQLQDKNVSDRHMARVDDVLKYAVTVIRLKV